MQDKTASRNLPSNGTASGSPPTIHWVNHASYVFEYDGVRLLSDPWLTGAVFNRGWRHISPTRFTPADFANITHVWYSHQHPDHFYPPDLRSVDPAVRSKIVVMYHKTIDKKVVRFCKGVGVRQQIEMDERRWYAISPTVSVCCGTWLERDSWMAIRTPHGTILNVNDCYIDTPGQVRNIAKAVGPVKVLLTQYSYAQWVGNASTPELHRQAAREHCERMVTQIDGFRPEYVIPFASFVFFCNQENFYLNANMNRVGDVARFIEERTASRSVVLYPDDRWRVGDPHDWRIAAKRYETDFEARIAGGPVEFTRSVSMETLASSASGMLARLRKRNPLYFPVAKPVTIVRLSDLRKTVELTLDGLRVVEDDRPWDIELTSDSLHFCLKTPWGANALYANGRFTTGPNDGHTKFFGYFKLADWNDHGYLIAPHRFVVLGSLALRQLGRKLGRKAEAMRGAIPRVV